MRRIYVYVSIFSAIINILSLSGSLFMLEVYDRVIPSHSLPTLVALFLLFVGLHVFSGLLDILRTRIMARAAAFIDADLSGRVFSVTAGLPLRTHQPSDALKPVQELDQIRQFLGGPGLVALFDLPWMPIYLSICFLLHPLIGWLTAGAMLIFLSLTLLTNFQTRALTQQAAEAVAKRNRFGEAASRNAEALAAMGMMDRATAQWEAVHSNCISLQHRAADVAGMLSGISKALRYAVQSAALGLGAYLVIQGNMTGGMIVAASIIVARALAPVEQVIANWRNLLAARQAWQRLSDMFTLFPQEDSRTSIPAPQRSLQVENAFVCPPGTKRMTVQNIRFSAQAGTAIGIVGASASGKSSLARVIVGAWPLARGSIRLDGASLDQWPLEERGRHIGYMPQSVDLFPGTIAENIARLDANADDVAIVAAAQAAGVHDLIVKLPDGYETQVGSGGMNLSAGQRQRIALARALYGDPFLVVLDEPNSNLDADGDKALTETIARIRTRGGIVIVVAHRTSILSALDLMLVMESGAMKAFGPRDAVMKGQAARGQGRSQPNPSLKVIEGEGGHS